jgi:hypothetical protein
MRDQSTPSYRAIPTWLAELPQPKDAPPLLPHEQEGDGYKSFVRPAPPLPTHLLKRYWHMREARPWMNDAEIIRRLRDPEID